MGGVFLNHVNMSVNALRCMIVIDFYFLIKSIQYKVRQRVAQKTNDTIHILRFYFFYHLPSCFDFHLVVNKKKSLCLRANALILNKTGRTQLQET